MTFLNVPNYIYELQAHNQLPNCQGTKIVCICLVPKNETRSAVLDNNHGDRLQAVPDWCDIDGPALALVLWNCMPCKLQVPVKSTNAGGLCVAVLVLKCLVFNDIDHRANHV